MAAGIEAGEGAGGDAGAIEGKVAAVAGAMDFCSSPRTSLVGTAAGAAATRIGASVGVDFAAMAAGGEAVGLTAGS